MKKSRVIIITVVVILVVVGGGGMAVRSKLKGRGKPTVVRVEKAQRGELVEFVSAPGEIEPKTKVEISAKVSARVVELPYEEGKVVTCGDPDANPPVPASLLLRLDSKDLESRLALAEASRAAQVAQIDVEKARIAGQRASLAGLAASLEQAQRDLQRHKGLFESKDIAQAVFDTTRAKYDELKAQHEAAKYSLQSVELSLVVLKHNLDGADAGIAQAQETLSYTTITSPIDGVITRINAEVGELVMTGTMNNPGTVIMVVGDLSQMLVVAQVDESDVGKLEVGQKASVNIDAFPDLEFVGVVDSIALSHDMSFSRTKFFKTEILLDATEKKLYSGLTTHVDIETRKHTDVLKVPTQAVLGREIDNLPLEIRENSSAVDSAKTFVAVVYRYNDGKAVVTPVKIGQSDLTHTVITAGIKEGDKVVIGPYKVLETLEHGQKIQDEREVKAKKDARAGTKSDTDDANDAETASDTNDATEKE